MKSNSVLSQSSTLSSSFSLSSSSTALQSSSPSSLSSFTSSSLSSSSSSTSSASPSTMRHLLLSAAILILYASTLSQACFIRNCPKGGKRALDSSFTVGHRPCISCGPGNTGQCVGPNICCSPQFGCHMGTRLTDVCLKENESTTPCYVQGGPCGPHNTGKCVADGICCDSETCTMTPDCSMAGQSSNGDQEKVLRLLERLLKTRVD